MLNLVAMLPMGMVGPGQIAILAVLIIVLFGGKKIPELMRGMGRGMKEFKDAVNKDYTAEDAPRTNTPPKSSSNIETTKTDETI